MAGIWTIKVRHVILASFHNLLFECFVRTKELLAVDKTCVSVWVSGNLKKKKVFPRAPKFTENKEKTEVGGVEWGKLESKIKVKENTGRDKKKQQWIRSGSWSKWEEREIEREMLVERWKTDRQIDRQREQCAPPAREGRAIPAKLIFVSF